MKEIISSSFAPRSYQLPIIETIALKEKRRMVIILPRRARQRYYPLELRNRSMHD